MKPTEKQIRLYKKLREVAEPHHAYSDQMMAIAMFIDAELEQKSEAINLVRSALMNASGAYKALRTLGVEHCFPGLSRCEKKREKALEAIDDINAKLGSL